MHVNMIINEPAVKYCHVVSQTTSHGDFMHVAILFANTVTVKIVTK